MTAFTDRGLLERDVIDREGRTLLITDRFLLLWVREIHGRSSPLD